MSDERKLVSLGDIEALAERLEAARRGMQPAATDLVSIERKDRDKIVPALRLLVRAVRGLAQLRSLKHTGIDIGMIYPEKYKATLEDYGLTDEPQQPQADAEPR